MSVLNAVEKRQLYGPLRKLGKFAAGMLESQDKEIKK
jgi:hypothetical protein